MKTLVPVWCCLLWTTGPAAGQEPSKEGIDRVVKACNGSFISDRRSFSMKTSVEPLDGKDVLVLEDEICANASRGFQVTRFKAFCRMDVWFSPIRIDYTFESYFTKAFREKRGIGEKARVSGSVLFGDGKATFKIASLEGFPATDDRTLSETAVRKLYERELKIEPFELGGLKVGFGTTEPALLRTALLPEPRNGFFYAFVLPEDVALKIRHGSARDEGDTRVVSFAGVGTESRTGAAGVEFQVTARETLHAVKIRNGEILELTWGRQVLARTDANKIAEFRRAGIAALGE